jgi:hypothetical protein
MIKDYTQECSCTVLYHLTDAMRLARVVGEQRARLMLHGEKNAYMLL